MQCFPLFLLGYFETTEIFLGGSEIWRLGLCVEIEISDSIKILGVTLDSKLSFREHITEQLKKAYSKATALRRIRHFVPIDVMIRLYKAFILPHLEYCSPLFVGIGKVQSNRIGQRQLLHFKNFARSC